MISRTSYRAWTESTGGSTPDRSSVEALRFREFQAGEASGTVPSRRMLDNGEKREDGGDGVDAEGKVMRWTGSLARQCWVVFLTSESISHIGQYYHPRK
jgi:hypothetical protein